jgi:hypothetical protein
MKRILEDERPIQALYLPGEAGHWKVGEEGVSKIQAYIEDDLVWFAVFRFEAIALRVNSKHVETISYWSQP